MSSQEETIDALTRFYQQIVKHPGLDDSDLKYPPNGSGWETIDIEKLGAESKNDSVLAILRRIPYLVPEKGAGINVHQDTMAISYIPGSYHGSKMEHVNPLPRHCVYLTQGRGQSGYAIILDAYNGTITAYSTCGSEIALTWEEYEATPEHDRWRCHATLPAAEFLDDWANQYARLVLMLVPTAPGEELKGSVCGGSYHRDLASLMASERIPLLEMQPDKHEQQRRTSGIKDALSRELAIIQYHHEINVFNCFLRNGWPSSFDKPTCRQQVIELTKEQELKETRLFAKLSEDIDESDTVFNEAEAKAKIEGWWAPEQPVVRKETGGVAPSKAK